MADPREQATGTTAAVSQEISGGPNVVSAARGAGTTPRRSRTGASGGSGFDRMPGRRPMKEYPLTKGELYGLGTLGGAATLCFSLGSAAFGYAAAITKDMAFASNVPEKIIVYYSTMRDFAFYGSFGLFAVGLVLIVAGGIRVRQIIAETDHGS
jgi:hypothetical protein